MKTTINGKEIKLFGRKELSEEFTKIVQEYLANGYLINYSKASSGSQGEEMKIDLSNDNGKTVYRVWMCEDRESIDEDERWYYDRVSTMNIFIKRYDDCKNESTLWMSKGELVFEKKFYAINDRAYNFKVFCEKKEDCKSIMQITRERWENHSEHRYIDLSEKYNRLAIRCVRKIKGWKSAQLKDVKKVQRRIGYGYEIRFNTGKCCVIKTAK